MIIPKKLKRGDEIRVIAPARSLTLISEESKNIAVKRLEKLGFKVSFGKNVNEKDEFTSSSINSRIKDLHEAFKDKNVKAILTVIGGFNSNQLLKYIDYNLIKNNPKIICGYSDITALTNAITAKTGMITYSGPHFSTFGMKKGFEYNQEYFEKCLMNEEPFKIEPSDKWDDNEWYLDQEKREFIHNDGFFIINPGITEGMIIGANLCTFNLLQGTEFMPSLKDTVLLIEDDYESKPHHFDRDLQSIIHQPQFKGVKGIVIGRFQKESEMTNELLVKIIKTKKELNNIPVIANVDFGHTNPLITFPIGGSVKLNATSEKAELEIITH